MFSKDDIKLKYIIGTYKDNPSYPTIEDFEYIVKNWYWNEGGKNFIHEYRGLSETQGGNLVFTDTVLREKLDNNEEVAKNLLDLLIADRKINLIKATKFTNYYELIS
jgi:hypothetical protein